MSLVATLKIRSHRDCFLHISGEHKWRKLLSNTTSNNGIVVLELMWSNSQYTHRVFVTPSATLLLNTKVADEVQLDPHFAAAIGIKNNEQVHVQAVRHAVTHCKSVTVVPASSDDWAVCNQDKDFIMDHLQDQIRVVQIGLHFVLYKGPSLLSPKLRVVSMEPNTTCALLVRDTVVEILPSAPPSLGRSITSPPTSAEYNSGNSHTITDWFSSFFGITEPQNSSGKKYSDSGYSSGSGGSAYSGSGGGADSESTSANGSSCNSEVTTPISATSTPLSPSPNHSDLGTTMMNSLNIYSWFKPQGGAKTSGDVKRSTVDQQLKGSGNTIEVPNTTVKGRHIKQPSWPIVGRLLPENIDTPPLNVVLRVQAYSSTVLSLLNDTEQLDVYVHPSTLPVLYMRSKHIAHDASIAGYLVKMQMVAIEKPNKKLPKSDQDDDSLLAPQLVPSEDKGIIKALVVRLCFTSSYSSHLLYNRESSADLVNIKPGHTLISDSVRQQMGIRDFSRVRLTEVTNNMRIPCNGHSIKLTPLNNKNGLKDKELCETFHNFVDKVGIHSPFGVPLVYHMILSLQTKSGNLCNVEVKLSGSSKKKQTKDQPLGEDLNKEIDFILLEGKDLTGHRVSLSVETQPVKISISSSSDKSSSTPNNSDTNKTSADKSSSTAGTNKTSTDKSSSAANNSDNKMLLLPEMLQLREPLMVETLPPLGGIDDYVNEGIVWVTAALERQLAVTGIGHGLNAGGLLICGRSRSGGNAGCGITSIAKTICRKAIVYPLLAHIIVLECASYRGKSIRFKEVLSERLSEARWYQPSILLLDDLDHIASSIADGQHEHGTDAFNANRTAEIIRDTLIEEMDRGSSIVVIATAQSISAIHPKLLPSRGNHLFRKTIEISSPNLETRQEMLKVIVKSEGINVADLAMDWRRISIATEGYVVKDLINVVERAIHNSEKHRSHDNTLQAGRPGRSASVDTIAPPKLCYEDFKRALETYKPTALRSIMLYKPEDVGFDNVGGLEHIKQLLIETIQWPAKFPRVHSSIRLRRNSGVLLFGAPGTGKTMLAKALGKQFGLNFISIKGPELLSKYIGASEQAIRDVFIRAHSAKPCILFFDEFDALAPQRGHDNTGVTDRVVNQLLTQMDGIETLEGVYVLAASSRPDLIDPALLRPGRIDKHLYCELPTTDERVEILKALSKSLPLSDNIDFREIASDCENFTGADLKALLYNAQLLVAHKLIDNRSSEKINKGGAVNGIIPVKNIWPSSNVRENKEELSQKLRVIQRNISGKRNTKKKQVTTHENLIIMQSDILAATQHLQPSISQKDRLFFLRLYDNFVNKTTTECVTQKATLA